MHTDTTGLVTLTVSSDRGHITTYQVDQATANSLITHWSILLDSNSDFGPLKITVS